jgi:hypothetical protein
MSTTKRVKRKVKRKNTEKRSKLKTASLNSKKATRNINKATMIPITIKSTAQLDLSEEEIPAVVTITMKLRAKEEA